MQETGCAAMTDSPLLSDQAVEFIRKAKTARSHEERTSYATLATACVCVEALVYLKHIHKLLYAVDVSDGEEHGVAELLAKLVQP